MVNYARNSTLLRIIWSVKAFCGIARQETVELVTVELRIIYIVIIGLSENSEGIATPPLPSEKVDELAFCVL